MKTQRSVLPALFILALLALAPWPAAASRIAVRADAMIVPGDATNYGQLQSIEVRDGVSWMLLHVGQFNFPSNVGEATWDIERATLYFYVEKWNGVSGMIQTQMITSAWQENSVNGTTPLTVDYGHGWDTRIDGAGRWYAVSATPTMMDWVFYRDKSRGLGLYATEGLEVSIAGRDSAHAPYMEVTVPRSLRMGPFYTKHWEVDLGHPIDPTAPPPSILYAECDHPTHSVVRGNAYIFGARPSSINSVDFAEHRYRVELSHSGGSETYTTVSIDITCWVPPGVDEWVPPGYAPTWR